MNAFISALPVIISLVIIEGLMSVDNALVLSSMVSHLPNKQQKLALRVGLLGAYLTRGLALSFAYVLISNPWVSVAGGAYLVYLMCKNLGAHSDGARQTSSPAFVHGFWATVALVELSDATMSIDNVTAAAAFSHQLWVLITGVFIGVLVMRLIAGQFLGILRRRPVLGKVAYAIVGLVGIQLIVQQAAGLSLSEPAKFGTILSLIALGLLYERSNLLARLLRPVLAALRFPMMHAARICDSVFSAITFIVKVVARHLHSSR